MPDKVLIITYYWPPSGGAGVQRWVKFAKYLPEYGWEPVILTVDPRNAAYPVTDNSLNAEIPSSLKIFKTPATDYFAVYNKDRSRIPSAGFATSHDNSLKGRLLRFIRGNFFIPDPRKGWNRYAFRKACELIPQMGIKHVITTSPPHSTQLIGSMIKKEFPGIKWIADLRDPWTDIYYYRQFYPTFISRKIDKAFEKRVLREADRIITVGITLKNLFSSKVAGTEQKTEVITNGYDDEDFRSTPPPGPGSFTITYVGTLSDIYPVEGFIEALSVLEQEGKRFLLRFIGAVSQRQKDLIGSKINAANLMFIPYVAHSEAIGYMRSSSALLLVIPDHESNRSIITGKIFEYLASDKPVICLGPVDGDASAIIGSAIAGETFDYNDNQGIANFLRKLADKNFVTETGNRNKYSRKQLTARLSEILKKD